MPDYHNMSDQKSNIREIILQEIEREGVARFAKAWGFTPNQVKTVQRTKKPSAAMLERAFEFMQASQEPPALEEEEQPQPPQPRGRTPRPQPFRRAPGIAPMFTDPEGADHPASTIRPAIVQRQAPQDGAPFIVEPTQRRGAPKRHPGIALQQNALHATQPPAGLVVPEGVDARLWMMFLQFAQMMGFDMGDSTQEIMLPGGNVMETMDDPGYGHNWNIPYGKKPAQQQQQRRRK
jgi:hypothetical protein